MQPQVIAFYGHTAGPYACFSNFYPARFTVNIDGDDLTFHCSEQYLMLRKALLFGDKIRAVEIMRAKAPAQIKSLGRKVTNFNAAIWSSMCEEIMRQGLLAKFSQNPNLAEILRGTGNAIIAEASPRDTIWGIGMATSNPHAQDPEKWKGTNLLGYALMQIRAIL